MNPIVPSPNVQECYNKGMFWRIEYRRLSQSSDQATSSFGLTASRNIGADRLFIDVDGFHNDLQDMFKSEPWNSSWTFRNSNHPSTANSFHRWILASQRQSVGLIHWKGEQHERGKTATLKIDVERIPRVPLTTIMKRSFDIVTWQALQEIPPTFISKVALPSQLFETGKWHPGASVVLEHIPDDTVLMNNTSLVRQRETAVWCLWKTSMENSSWLCHSTRKGQSNRTATPN